MQVTFFSLSGYDIMKFIKFYSSVLMLLMLLLYNGCSGNQGDGLSAGVNPGPDFTTPVIFVHGLTGIGGDTFYNMYEKFAAFGFPESKMAILLLPRIGAGAFDDNYAWYTPVSPFSYSSSHWKGNYVNADALREEIDRLAPDPGSKVNLVGHSNGSAVILKLLVRHPAYALKINKIVFISGFADVSGADGRDNIISDLQNCMPFKSLPVNISYYAISSESDANINLVETVYGRPSNDNPGPLGDTIRYWRMDDTDSISETNLNIPGMDHQGIITCDRTARQVYEWLTGAAPGVPVAASTITVGGRIAAASGYSQHAVASGSVKLEYYDPANGSVTGSAGECAISSDGRYSFSGVSTDKHLKMTVAANGGTCVYFFSDRIVFNSGALDFDAPGPLAENNSDGMVSVNIMCRYSFLSSEVYGKRRADSFSGMVRAEGCSDVFLDSSCIPMSAPASCLSVNINNYGATDTTTGTGNTFNFDPDLKNDYASKNMFIAADLQNTGAKTVIRINGADRKNNIKNYIVYLYHPAVP